MRSPEWFNRGGDADSIDRAVDAFEARIESGRPSLSQFWGEFGSSKTRAILAALVKVDLRRRFERGERPRVLEYLEEFPSLTEDGDRVVSLVYEEFCLLEEAGDRPDSGIFCDDYGPWRDSLASQLAYHRELSRAVGAESPSVIFPDPGDRFGKYRLDSILGVGGVARVYLATEDELGGRQLAIKVSASFGQEPSILAKLDHRNIVPILTVAESESGLRGICMPYRPGQTLEDLIKRIGRGTPPRSARAISEAMQPRNSPAGFAPDEQRVGWADFPVDRTFPEAVAWVGLALSQALSYLHDKGIFHRDIKPANILLAYREGPQLLDFNLAQVPNNPEGASAAQKGGTLPYMAPEQLRAFLDPSAWKDVEEAADLYSLGLVLRELLTGRAPELPRVQGSLAREIQELLDRRSVPQDSIREDNPGVPPALDSIIGKCLAFQPGQRYAAAKDLAADLRQFLDRKPLLNVPNPSKVELGVNWIFRNRHAIVATVLFSALLFTILGLFRPDDRGSMECRDAENYLDSGTLGNLLNARPLFEKLLEKQANTATPSLGLALTLIKLNELDPVRFKEEDRVNKLIRDARNKPDAEEVFRARLVKDRDSPRLLLNLGIVLSEKKARSPSERKSQFAEARRYFERTLEKDPDALAALANLANLDQMEGNEDQAVLRLESAIRLGLARDVGEKRVYGLRQALLNNLVTLIDRRLEGKISRESLAETEAYRRQLETNLVSFASDDWERCKADVDANLHRYSVNYYEGCLRSIRGVLNSKGGDPARSKGLFDEAEGHFRIAESIVPHLSQRIDRQSRVKQQVENLGRRRSRWVSAK